MITLTDIGRAMVISEAAQIDKLTLRVVGSLRWLGGSECRIAPVEILVDTLARGRSVFGRRMARSFRLACESDGHVWRLSLVDPQLDRRWSFGVRLKFISPRAAEAMHVPYELVVDLNPTRQLAAARGRVPRIGAADCVLDIPSSGEAGWTQSNMLPDEILVQPVANWRWVDAATDIAERTVAFVVEQVFGEREPEIGRQVRQWEVTRAPPSISEVECFWEFSHAQPRQTVQRLCSAFTGGSAQSGAHRWAMDNSGMNLTLISPLTQNVRAVLYPKGEEGQRIRLELRYHRRVATALPGIGRVSLHDKFRMIADDAARRANDVLRTIRPHLGTSGRATPSRYGELAGELVRVLGAHPHRVTDVMVELLTRGGITAGRNHLVSINEAERLVRSYVLVRRRMARSRHGRSFQLGRHFLPLCRMDEPEV